MSRRSIGKALSRAIQAGALSVLILDENRVRAAILEPGLGESRDEAGIDLKKPSIDRLVIAPSEAARMAVAAALTLKGIGVPAAGMSCKAV